MGTFFGWTLPTSVLIAIGAIATPSAQTRPRTLLVLQAHADDETAASAVLARYAREGVRVHRIGLG